MENKEKDIKELNENEVEQASGGFTGTILGDRIMETIISETKKFGDAIKNNVNPNPIDR